MSLWFNVENESMNSQDKPYEEYEIKMTKIRNFQKKQNSSTI